jgi:hypothetical protein
VPNPFTFNLGPFPAAANAANIVVAATPAAAGNLPLVGAGPVLLDGARKVLVTYGNENAARTVKIYGTNVFKVAISEVVPVPAGGAGTAATIQDFLTITQVQVFSAFSANMSVGTNAEASTPWFFCDWARNPFSVGYAIWLTGAGTFNLEATFDDPNAGYAPTGVDPTYADSTQPLSNVPPKVFADPVNFGAAKNASFQGQFTQPVFALRATLASGVGAGASLQFQGLQNGIFGA